MSSQLGSNFLCGGFQSNDNFGSKSKQEIKSNPSFGTVDENEEDLVTAIDIGLTAQTSLYNLHELNPHRSLVMIPSQYALKDLHDYRLYIPYPDGSGITADPNDPQFLHLTWKPYISPIPSEYYTSME